MSQDIFNACSLGDADALEQHIGFGAHEAVRGAHRCADGMKRTPLVVASMRGHTECVRMLLAAGAPIGEDASDGCAPLFVAAQEGHAPCVQLLLNGRAIATQANHDGDFPLHIATNRGHLECVRMLIDAQAAIDQQMPAGDNALFAAAQDGNVELVRLLLSAQASVDIAIDDGACGCFSRVVPTSSSPLTTAVLHSTLPPRKAIANVCSF